MNYIRLKKNELQGKVRKFCKRVTNTVLRRQKLRNRLYMIEGISKGFRKRLFFGKLREKKNNLSSITLSGRDNLGFELMSSSFRIYVFKYM